MLKKLLKNKIVLAVGGLVIVAAIIVCIVMFGKNQPEKEATGKSDNQVEKEQVQGNEDSSQDESEDDVFTVEGSDNAEEGTSLHVKEEADESVYTIDASGSWDDTDSSTSQGGGDVDGSDVKTNTSEVLEDEYEWGTID